MGFNTALIENITPEHFTGEYWKKENAISGQALGRGITWFIHHNNQDWVLRHYYRGGLIGKLITDHYIYTGLEKTRAQQEFSLLQKMQQWSLPAPKPVAYKIERHGLFYQADLLSERINNAEDLVGILAKRSLTDNVYLQIGQTIKQFHQRGIYHHDLNIHNILIDDNNKIWLIDFDRGEIRNNSGQWQQENLDRLLRSFKKEHTKHDNFNWEIDQWQFIIAGYHQE